MTYDQEIKLKSTLKRKMRPAISDGAMVPMSVYYGCVGYDGSLLKKFLQLSKGMRKHLLFYIYDIFQPVVESLEKQYGHILEFEDSYIS